MKDTKPPYGSTMEQLLKQMDKIEEGEETRKIPATASLTSRQSFREMTFAKTLSQQREKSKSNVVKFYNVIPDSVFKIESHPRNKSPNSFSKPSTQKGPEQESSPSTKHVALKISPLRSANFNLKLPQRTHSQIKIKPILTLVNKHEHTPKNPNIHLTIRAMDPLIATANFENFAAVNKRFQCHTTRESGAKSPFGDLPLNETENLNENQKVESMKQIPLFVSDFALKKRESLIAPLRLPSIPNKVNTFSPASVRGTPSLKNSLVFDHLEANHQAMSEGNTQSSTSIKSSPKAHSDASPQVKHIGRFGSLGYINSPQSPIQIGKNSPIILTSGNNDYFFKNVSETPNTLKNRIVAFQTRRESPTFSFKTCLADTRTKQ